MKQLFLSIITIIVACNYTQSIQAADYVTATVLNATEIAEIGPTYELELQLATGGTPILLEHQFTSPTQVSSYSAGEKVVVQVVLDSLNQQQYILYESYRMPKIFLLITLFFLLGIVVAKWSGVRSLGGLIVSVALLFGVILPLIIQGYSASLVSFIGAIAIATISLYVTHGVNTRTTIAVIATNATLVFAAVIAYVSVALLGLLGLGSEHALFLQSTAPNVQLQGVLLGGILIGALGVLDDITTSQTAAIDQLSKANPSLGAPQLYKAGIAIGREHIAALINTLALAYAGASLPLLLLFSIDLDVPWWVLFNTESIAEEIIRTLVGSAALIVAVPITTQIASRKFAYGNHVGGKSHVCSH